METEFEKASKMENTSNGHCFTFLEVIMVSSLVESDDFILHRLELSVVENRQIHFEENINQNFDNQREVTLVAVS